MSAKTKIIVLRMKELIYTGIFIAVQRKAERQTSGNLRCDQYRIWNLLFYRISVSFS